jgi:mannitol/fructose-specific phosphotransferase system IIA component (Ntr-type)
MASPEAVIRFLIGRLVELGQVSPEHAARAACQVVARERQSPTAIGAGAALPHSKSEVPGVVGIVGRSPVPLPWSGADGVPVREACLLLTPVDQPRASMRALQHAVAVLSREGTDAEPGAAPDRRGM